VTSEAVVVIAVSYPLLSFAWLGSICAILKKTATGRNGGERQNADILATAADTARLARSLA
jgi:hypothetical protein